MSAEAAKIGRPPIEINPDTLYTLAKLGLSQRHAAETMGLVPRTLERRLEETEVDEGGNEGPGVLRREWDRGHADKCYRLHELQMIAAEKGDVKMLTHLGKHYLGQVDKRELTGAEGAPLHPSVPVVVAVTSEVAGTIYDELERMGGFSPGGNGSEGNGVHAAPGDVDSEATRFPQSSTS